MNRIVKPQYVTKITLTTGVLQYNPDFFCYGKYKNDNIIMVILLRIVNNSTTCWLELRNISRTTKLFDNKCRHDNKRCRQMCRMQLFVFRDLRFQLCLWCSFLIVANVFLMWQIVNELSLSFFFCKH